MAYTDKQKEELTKAIFKDISEGMSLVKACLKNGMQRSAFYEWGLHESDNYAKACDERSTRIFEEALEIADDESGDVQRDKLRIDTRKWFLSKMAPKKYGDKLDIDHTTKGESMNDKPDLSKVTSGTLKQMQREIDEHQS